MQHATPQTQTPRTSDQKKLKGEYQDYLKKLNLSLIWGDSLSSKISISPILDPSYISRANKLILQKSLQIKAPINLRHMFFKLIKITKQSIDDFIVTCKCDSLNDNKIT